MGLFNRKQKRSAKTQRIAIANSPAFAELCAGEYTSLADCPEIIAGIDTIAQLVGSMTIYLMENRFTASGEYEGDFRVRDELAKKVDVNPNSNMTRATFMAWIVKTLLLNGNAVVEPKTRSGFLDDLVPLPPRRVSFEYDSTNGRGYKIIIDGKAKNPETLLHFAINTDESRPYIGAGYRGSLKALANSLKQRQTTKTAFMRSEWKPSLIIKIDGDFEGLNSPDGRENILKDYVRTNNAGDPWLLPMGRMDVEQIKPLTLNDLAINAAVEMDKKTVASILGVPAFVLGVGSYSKSEFNNFVNTKIMFIARIIEQELTKKLIYSPNRYFKFNPRSILAYDLNELATVSFGAVERRIMDRNEARDWLGLSPRDGLSELAILENYIPFDAIGDQEKLNGSDTEAEE